MVVGDIVRTTATRYPQKVGVIFEDRRYTWQQVNARVNSLARGLLGLGLKKQDRVAILCRNCNQYLEFYFATAKAGLVAVVLATSAPGSLTLFWRQDTITWVSRFINSLKEEGAK